MRTLAIGRVVALWLVCAVGLSADWPQWRGPARDGISTETGLLTSWPAGGPGLLWTASGLGEGYSAVSVAGDRVYVMGQRDVRQAVMAFDAATGRKIWETPIASGFAESRGNGPRGTPTVDGSRLYAMSATGALVCLDAATGKVVWTKDVVRTHRGSIPGWGISESPLIDGDRVIVMPGGRGASLVALNKQDGSPIWQAGNDPASYSSPVAGDFGGVRQIIAVNANAAVGVRADTGQQLWRYTKVANQTANIATPIIHDGHVFVSTRRRSSSATSCTGSTGGF